jgi:hypothetical protein
MPSENEKNKPKPICADCRKMEYGTRMCREMGIRVNRTDDPCSKFVSKNPRYHDA